MDKPLWGLRVQAPLGARVLSFVCCAPNDGFGPQSGLVQRGVLYAAAWGSENRTTALTGVGNAPLLVAGATTFPPAGGLYSSLCVSFILPPLAGEVRRSRKGGGERSEPIRRMLIMSYDTESKSRNVLASPLGEEGHEVAKGCTRVRMIMILDVDVTAERRHYNTHRP